MPQVKATEELTAAKAAAMVKREVPVMDAKGKPTGKTRMVAVKADEVFACKDHGDYVNVVTVDGRKLRGAK